MKKALLHIASFLISILFIFSINTGNILIDMLVFVAAYFNSYFFIVIILSMTKN